MAKENQSTGEAEFFVTSAIVNISPKVPIFIGCGPPQKILDLRSSELEANILLVRASDASPVILFVSLDALYVGPRLRQDIEAELGRELRDVEIIFSASHSHFAPMLDDTKPKLGKVVEEHYVRVLSDLIAGIRITLGAESSKLVKISHHRYRTRAPMYRRRVVPLALKNGKLEFFRSQWLPHPFRRLRVFSDIIKFTSVEGIEACIWIMPCHPVSYIGPNKISADYVGVARTALRESVFAKPKTPVVFIQGASGDLRPSSIGLRKLDSVKSLAVNLLYGPSFIPFNKDGWLKWVSGLTTEFMGAIREASPIEKAPFEGNLVTAQRHALRLNDYFEFAYSRERFLTIQSLQLAGVHFLGVSAEVSWELRSLLAKALDDPELVVGGCIEDNFGYLSSSGQARWGGYEVEGFLEPFSLIRRACDVESELFQQILLVCSEAESSD